MTMATEALDLGEADVVIVAYELAGVRGEDVTISVGVAGATI